LVNDRAGGDAFEALDDAIRAALDGLLRTLELNPLGGDRFRVDNEPGRFGRIFGGQLIAQVLLAAGATVAAKAPHSLDAYFVATGATARPLQLAVERVRDRRSMSTRRVTVTQDGRTLLTAMVSFHDNPPQPELADAAPSVPAPEDLPRLQDWAAQAPPELQDGARNWIRNPPPLHLHIGEPADVCQRCAMAAPPGAPRPVASVYADADGDRGPSRAGALRRA
jgi:acyl-CoA thioesterase II